MENGFRSFVCSFVLLTLPVLAMAEDFRYVPKPMEGGQLPPGVKEEIRVKRITIKPGDTLYDLSRAYGGKGPYYSQILLFNEIRNPNLIIAGKELTVPVREGAAVEKKAATVSGKDSAGKRTVKKKKRGAKVVESKVVTTPEREREPTVSSKPAGQVETTAAPVADEMEQLLYKKGITAYRQGEYAQAIEAFDRFLNRYATSLLAPDVALYRAESYMKLSGQ